MFCWVEKLKKIRITKILPRFFQILEPVFNFFRLVELSISSSNWMSVTLNRSDTKLSQINNYCHPVLWDIFHKKCIDFKKKTALYFVVWTLGTRVLSTWLSRFFLANVHLLLWYQSVCCPFCYFLVSYFNWSSNPLRFYSVLEYCCHTTSMFIYCLETHIHMFDYRQFSYVRIKDFCEYQKLQAS